MKKYKIDTDNYNFDFTLVSHNSDIDSEHQRGVEDYLKQKYGVDKVCHIANFSKFGPKTIVKDLCRIYELDFLASNKLTGVFDPMGKRSLEEELINARNVFSKQNSHKLVSFIDENQKLLLEKGKKFDGLIRQVGRHASGILISNKELINSDLPVYNLKGDIVTGVQEGGDEREITELGYLKLDILGLIAASVMNDAMKRIENHYNVKNLENMILKSNLDDKQVYEEFCKGNCRDIFQFGSDSMIQLIKRVKPTCIEDLSAINAAWRPAVIQSGSVDEFCNNRLRRDEIKEELDKVSIMLYPILKDSEGCILFQEQIMHVLQKVGGFTLDEADKARKTLKLLHKGNQDKRDNFNAMLDKFRKNAIKNGVSEEDADELLSRMAKYSEYSFNMSHSLSYGINGFVAMWLKVYFPYEYYSALINYSSEGEISWFIKDAKAHNVNFSIFTCNNVSERFQVNYDEKGKAVSINMGLFLVKGAQSKDISLIVDHKFTSVKDLLDFIISNKIGKRTIEPLCRLQFFSNLYKNSKVLEFTLLDLKDKSNVTEEQLDETLQRNEVEDYNKSEKIVFEKKYMGFYLSEHPFNRCWNILQNMRSEVLKQLKTPKDTNELQDGEYMIAGVVNQIFMKKTKKSGKEYYKILLEDDLSQIYITVWSIEDIADIKVGDFISMKTSKNSFGFVKSRGAKIVKFFK